MRRLPEKPGARQAEPLGLARVAFIQISWKTSISIAPGNMLRHACM